MTEYVITNDELLDYLRHDLDDEKRKEIATRLYNDTELQTRFKEIQRIEALVSENYDFGKVNISSETEKNVVRYINETVANIITEKEQNILSVKKLIEENEIQKKETAKRKYIYSSVGWAAVIVLCFVFIFDGISSISKNNQSIANTNSSNIKSASELEIKNKTPFESLEMEVVVSNPVKLDDDNVVDVNPEPGTDKNISNPDKVSNKRIEKNLRKFNNSDLVKKLQGDVPSSVLKIDSEEPIRGDVNKDGKINKDDLDLLTSMLKDESAHELGLPADMDKDNVITVKDLVLLAKIVESSTEAN